MAASNSILIADRNSHVRTFLMRELMAEGYRVILAATAENVLKIVFTRDDIDLLVLDPHLPGVDAATIFGKFDRSDSCFTDRAPHASRT